MENKCILEIKGIKKRYRRLGLGGSAVTTALDGVEMALFTGETLGLVGESGCGKSTLAKIILLLEKPDEGQVLYHGRDISQLCGEELNRYRREVGMVFQDPLASINPRHLVAKTVGEPLALHLSLSQEERQRRLEALLKLVGLPSELLSRYPHALSGGQRQRVGIARAIAVNPRLLIADEPVSSLDVSVRAQLLNLFKDIQEEFSLSLLFISHDLSVVRFISNRIAVMYAGMIVETASTATLYEEPHHPYTKLLFASIPRLGKRGGDDIGERVRATAPNFAKGCPFAPSCARASNLCREDKPLLVAVGQGHLVACHLFV